ncbi:MULTISPECIES: RNA-binding S4 domain-containing protein [Roseovarius]|uniref:RNA-binding S4 domain-containing protein n=1 Tax=Roseovarius TaxID=74030 RepID=UPI001C9522F1|nr:RNA-binding S4 domain-containing protein [Roseovarius atlanticus]MBY5988002.1 RNA-binding S4 domain-containing protein [Roseovarius atlanticus]MBY6123393.1 RNA-binding S4 domain-containing protein [Roseovarius atlanticus]MBY6147888.1 RNA-binding S4 domain-containing protein [Roseovarius atlanticus]
MSDAGQPKIRLDKWLWHARFFKTRSLATKLVTGGHVRVNSQRVSKASSSVRPGDVLTFPKERDIRVIRIVAVGERRGPAPEAQALYHDLDPPKPRDHATEPLNPRYEGKGRPTKKDRRKMDQETR